MSTAPWIRGLIFTVLVPGTIALYVPLRMAQRLTPPGGFWEAGWLVSAVGALGYFWCFLGFLTSGGTPAIFFTRPVRFLLGEEPRRLVQKGLYRISRNPMYVSVLLVIFGQALRFASRPIAEYGLFVWLGFHIVVVALEEPHLREERGPAYEEYCRRVPRWLLRLRAPGIRLSAASVVIAATLFGCSPSGISRGAWRSERLSGSEDGSRGGFQTSPAIYRALGEGDVRRDYSKVRVPVLALVDYPRWDDGPWREDHNL